MNLLTQSNAIPSQTGMRNENARRQLPLFPITCQRNTRNGRTVFVCLVIANDKGWTHSVLHMGVIVRCYDTKKADAKR